jgi:choline dehydrogenase-like flavoprotein
MLIGAGWAGMAAADALARAKVNFTILEASHRTGGRTHAMKFGSADVKNFIIERGSNWISGGCLGQSGKCGTGGVAKGMQDYPSENPVWALGKHRNNILAVLSLASHTIAVFPQQNKPTFQ